MTTNIYWGATLCCNWINEFVNRCFLPISICLSSISVKSHRHQTEVACHLRRLTIFLQYYEVFTCVWQCNSSFLSNTRLTGHSQKSLSAVVNGSRCGLFWTAGSGVPCYESPQFPGRISECLTCVPLLSSCSNSIARPFVHCMSVKWLLSNHETPE